MRENCLEIARRGAEKYAPQQLDLLRRFAAVDCGTGNLEGNAKVISIMDEVFSTMAVEVEHVDAPGLGMHVVARIRPQNPQGKILLNSHIDTVFKPGDTEKYPFHIKEDYAYGLGVADCKGGFVTSCFAVKIAQEAGILPNKEIVMIYNCDEEIGSPSGKDVFQREGLGAEMAFVFEPAREENGLLTSRKGSIKCRVEVTGRKAHAGLKYKEGRSATVELAQKLLALYELNNDETGVYYNVGPLGGGEAGTGVVADHAWADVGVKPSTAADMDNIMKAVAAVAEKPFIDGCITKIDTKVVFPMMERTPGNVALYQKLYDIGKLLGQDYPEQTSAGSSDACYFSTMGIPTVDGLGPYMYDIHTTNERLRISTIAEKTMFFAAVLGML